jgi:hypothetical protein
MFGPPALTKDSGWQRSPVHYAVEIITKELFSVVKVKPEVEAHFGCNPFSRPHNLFQQIVKSLYSGLKERQYPIIWRTIPSAQLKYKTPVGLNVPNYRANLTEEELRSSEDYEAPITQEIRQTDKDNFNPMVMTREKEGGYMLKTEWKKRVEHLSIEPECYREFSKILHVLCSRAEGLHAEQSGGVKLTVEKLDSLTKGLLSKLYPTKKQLTEFWRGWTSLKTKREKPFFKGRFVTDIGATAQRTDVFKIEPKDEDYKELWRLQKVECEKLSGLLLEKGCYIAEEMGPATGTFPWYLADSYGIWCEEFSTLICNMRDVHDELVGEYQVDDAMGDREKDAILQRYSEFLGVFARGQGACNHRCLKKPS